MGWFVLEEHNWMILNNSDPLFPDFLQCCKENSLVVKAAFSTAHLAECILTLEFTVSTYVLVTYCSLYQNKYGRLLNFFSCHQIDWLKKKEVFVIFFKTEHLGWFGGVLKPKKGIGICWTSNLKLDEGCVRGRLEQLNLVLAAGCEWERRLCSFGAVTLNPYRHKLL